MFLVPEPGRVEGVYLSCGYLETGNGSTFLSTLREGIASAASDFAQPKGLFTGLRE